MVCVLLPNAVMAPRQITMIMDSMTAYSTAVGPSSAFRNVKTLFANARTADSRLTRWVQRKQGKQRHPAMGGGHRGAPPPLGTHSSGMIRRSAAGGQGVLNGRERSVGILSQSRDGADAHHDDQGEHDRVLDRGRAVFRLQELEQVLRELTHGNLRWMKVTSLVWLPDQLPVGSAFLTVSNVVLAFCPRAVMVPMHTTMIRASITAYSTAVGPSSAFRNLSRFFAN